MRRRERRFIRDGMTDFWVAEQLRRPRQLMKFRLLFQAFAQKGRHIEVLAIDDGGLAALESTAIDGLWGRGGGWRLRWGGRRARGRGSRRLEPARRRRGRGKALGHPEGCGGG